MNFPNQAHLNALWNELSQRDKDQQKETYKDFANAVVSIEPSIYASEQKLTFSFPPPIGPGSNQATSKPNKTFHFVRYKLGEEWGPWVMDQRAYELYKRENLSASKNTA